MTSTAALAPAPTDRKQRPMSGTTRPDGGVRPAPRDGQTAATVWSTRQLAELAGTSLRAVRHYHDSGLLDEPVRSTNGYKHYSVQHLLRLLQIRHLTDLGMTLTQVAAVGADGDDPASTLTTLHARLTRSIAQLERSRADIAALLASSSPDLSLPCSPGPVPPP